MKRSLLLLSIVLLVPVTAYAAPVSAGNGTPSEQAGGQASAPRAAATAEFQRGYARYQGGDYRQALTEWRRAAAQGDAPAESNLGVMYTKGQGVPQNYAKALKWYRLAAAQHFAMAEFSLGFVYTYGQGVPQNYAKALKWFRRAAAQGDAPAESNLGVMYTKGQGVPQNYAKALKWYRLAAAQGYAHAEYNLGVMYAEGQGVPQDYVKAYKWLLLSKATLPATDRHYPAVTKAVAVFAAAMTPAQIAQAQREASAWYATHQHTAQ